MRYISRIKKIIGTALISAVAISAFSATAPSFSGLIEEVSAANGDNGVYFYDFEDYTANFGEGKGPDDNIRTLRIFDGTRDYQFNYKNYGRGNDGEHGGVMEEKSPSFPSFIFPKAITKGKIKISFDMKIEDPNNKSMPAFFLYGGKDDVLDRGAGDEMHLMWFNYGNSKEARYAKYCAAWNATTPLNGFDYDDAKQWNHYDFVFSEASSVTTPTVSGYINGKLAFENTLRNNEKSKSIRSFGIWMEGGDSSSRVYIDNFYVKHFMGKDVYTADSYGDNTFNITDGRIRVAMTERSREPVTKDNITVTNVTTGKKITNFDVENYTGQSFDIQIKGTVDYGRYDVSFNNIVGELNGSKISGIVTAYTEYKPAQVQASSSVDLNDYTAEAAADNKLPSGFVCLEGETLPAESIDGSSGEKGDYALGFKNIPNDDYATKRAMYRFESPIDGRGGLDISFDMYNKDATAYFYLAEDGDFPADVAGNKDYKKNALISIESSGRVKYASQRTTTPDKILNGVTAAAGQWHKVRVRCESDAESGKNYLNISVNGGAETRVETMR
ncbi:MAG: hypothetical protein Q4E94_06355, partial [Clostridia bacterium]|nr:hypothetical protein [Clostridia bacterium]